jgi:cytochrome c oxidase subunit III
MAEAHGGEIGEVRPAFQFATLEQQAHAARLGMWVFLASEVLLFSAFFGLWAAYYTHYPEAFYAGATHNSLFLGTFNTVVLIGSSWAVASADFFFHTGRVRMARTLLLVTVALAAVFLVVKGIEYVQHFDDGIFPGGRGHYFESPDRLPGEALYFNLYYVMTATHALHVIIGMTLLLWLVRRIPRLVPAQGHVVELGGLYWHLVDIIWIFIWPLFYLLRGT